MVPLLLQEANSTLSARAYGQAARLFAWHWADVETHAALLRRNADAAAWQTWQTLRAALVFVDTTPDDLRALNAFNDPLRLRAADAGHLFVFSRLAPHIPGLTLATFDGEMQAAATSLQLPVWQP